MDGKPGDPLRRLDVTRLLFSAPVRCRLEQLLARAPEQPPDPGEREPANRLEEET